jgi:hypothetical protein
VSEIVQLPRRRVLMRDPSLPHQIVIGVTPGVSNLIYVSCNCKAIKRPRGGLPFYEPLEERTRWEPDEILAVYRAHLPEEAS